MEDLPVEPDFNEANPIPEDLTEMHHAFKGRVFRAVDMTDIITGEVQYFTIICKEKGRGKKWVRLGNNKGPHKYFAEKDAKQAARKLREWAAV